MICPKLTQEIWQCLIHTSLEPIWWFFFFRVIREYPNCLVVWRETARSCSWRCWPHYSFLVLGSEIKSSQTETETLASWRSLLTPPWNRETGSKGGLGWFTGFIFKYKIYLYIYIFIFIYLYIYYIYIYRYV